jgi:exoribonuclease R
MDELKGAVDGDRVMARLVRWDKNDRKPQGVIESIIDARNESDLAMKEILIGAGFTMGFDDAVLKEAESFSEKITREELSKRKDFRDSVAIEKALLFSKTATGRCCFRTSTSKYLSAMIFSSVFIGAT